LEAIVKKILFVLFLGFGLFGCQAHEDGTPWTVSKRCIGGVVYYIDAYSLAPAFNPD